MKLELLAVVFVLGVELLDSLVGLLSLDFDEGKLFLDLLGVLLVEFGKLGLSSSSGVGGLNVQFVDLPYHFVFFRQQVLLHRRDLLAMQLTAFTKEGFILICLLFQL